MVSRNKSAKNDDEGGFESLSKRRMYLTIFLILGLSGYVLLRLYALQVKAHQEYRRIADGQHKFQQEILPVRGEIFLSDSEGIFPVAANRELMTAFSIPDEIENKKYVASEVSRILKLDHDEVLSKISKERDLYEVLKRKLSDEQVEEIKKLNIKGIELEGEQWRYYPGGDLASHIVGFLGYSDRHLEGMYGIERHFERELSGKRGLLEQERDTFGRWISIGSKSMMPAEDGNNIILAIDHVLQFKAQIALKNAVKRHGADGGKIVIVDPYSGKIMAMAAVPDFNPNNYNSVEDISVFRNPIVSDTFECGSVFKTFTMAAGLDSGKVEPNTSYFDTGEVREAGFTIRNSDKKAHGKQTMTNVIEKSLNTGAIHVQRMVGNQQFFKYVKEFGFGKQTGIQLPGEAGGNLSNLETNRDIEFFTASFGQGITVTPLQLAMAYGVIANGGQLMEPLIVDSIQNHSGVFKIFEPQMIRTVISKETSNKLKLMLENNVVNGHGKPAGVPGYRIAGKTGTAQIPDRVKGGYLEKATTGTFAGFGPVENPIFAMIVIIDHPRDVEWAESTAAPLFGEMSKSILDYFVVKPTEEYSQEDLEHFTKTHNYMASETDWEKSVPVLEKEE